MTGDVKNPHELATFLQQDLAEMASEYERIRARTTEDPGTAGDEGEEVWAELLRRWLPDNYRVVTKGRVLSATGEAGPQVDVLVLRPGYPVRLINKKLYLAAGVAYVFECKNTLLAEHLSSAFERAAAVNRLSSWPREPSPFSELVPEIPFGLLAHSHAWRAPGSHPEANVDTALQTGLTAMASATDAPSVVCVADLACWTMLRMTYDGPGLMPAHVWQARQELTGLPPEGAAHISYMRHTDDSPLNQAPPNAVAAAIVQILQRLAHADTTLGPLVQYFHVAGLSGSASGVASRTFGLDTYSDVVRRDVPSRLTTGGWATNSDWQLVYPF